MIITREHRSKPYPLGVRVVGDALEVAVYSESADAVDLCVFDDAGRETAHRLPERSGHVFHGRVEGHGVGTRYGLRVTGAWDPANGRLLASRQLALAQAYAAASPRPDLAGYLIVVEVPGDGAVTAGEASALVTAAGR